MHFVTDGLPAATLSAMSVSGLAVPPGGVGPSVQELLDRALAGGQTLAAFPEGPYCAPVQTSHGDMEDTERMDGNHR